MDYISKQEDFQLGHFIPGLSDHSTEHGHCILQVAAGRNQHIRPDSCQRKLNLWIYLDQVHAAPSGSTCCRQQHDPLRENQARKACVMLCQSP